jgi:hypothetical protein
MAVVTDPQAPVAPASPAYRLILLLVFALTAAAMVASVCLATWGRENGQTAELIDAFTKGYLMGLAGILGLIGGRVLEGPARPSRPGSRADHAGGVRRGGRARRPAPGG